jgi:N-acetylglucosamine-6-sulfatase
MNCSATFEHQHYGNFLQTAGYTTAYFGKYLNPPEMEPFCKDNSSTPVPGWNHFLGMCVTAYYNIPWVTSDGTILKTGDKPEEYSTSIVGNRTVDFIRDHAAHTSRDSEGRLTKPFFVSAATRAPHGPQTPAPWYKDHQWPDGSPAMRTPAWNNTGRHEMNHVGWVENNPPITAKEAKTFDSQNTDRWRTLLSVDDLVESIVKTLEELSLLDHTYILSNRTMATTSGILNSHLARHTSMSLMPVCLFWSGARRFRPARIRISLLATLTSPLPSCI